MGWATIRVEPCAKRPIGSGWQNRIDEPEAFQSGENIGVRLGSASGGLVDIDLDCLEAVHLAPLFLPPTMTFGRSGKPKSHWLYKCSAIDRTDKPPRASVEMRSTGGQTVFPGSIHETGESIDWSPDAQTLREISETDLRSAFGKLVAATVIAKCWPEAQRAHDAHHVVLALAGALYHEGWAEEDALALLIPATELTGGADPGHRTAAIVDTFADHERQRYGWPTLVELLGPLDQRAIQRGVERVPTIPRAVAAAIDVIGPGDRPLTDAGNAERLFDDYGDNLRHIQGLGWHVWSGIKWDISPEPFPYILRSVRKLQRFGVESGNAAAAKWGRQSESSGRLGAIEMLARKTDLRTRAEHLDADPMLLCCRNGTIDLRTGELREHRREDLITKCAGFEYDVSRERERGGCPRFVQYLNEIFLGDPILVQYMVRFLGYCLSGRTDEHAFQLWHGHGSNGKSTLVELMLRILGDYATKLPGEMLIASKTQGGGDRANPAMVRMRGARFAAGTETTEGQRWNEPLVKELTGGDTVSARALYKDQIEFRPSWKIAIAVNHKPVVRGTDYGIWRRIHLVPFDATFNGERKDPQLLSKLEAEGPGILGLLVAGCLAWQREGLGPAPRVIAAAEDYKRSQDVVGSFVSECCAIGIGLKFKASRAKVYQAYKQWAADSGEHQHGKHAFNRMLEDRGYEWRAPNVWIGLKLLSGGL